MTRAALRRELKGDDGGGLPSRVAGTFLTTTHPWTRKSWMTCTWRRRLRRRGPPAAAARGATADGGVRLALGALAGCVQGRAGSARAARRRGHDRQPGDERRARVLPGVMTHRARDDASAPSRARYAPPSRGGALWRAPTTAPRTPGATSPRETSREARRCCRRMMPVRKTATAAGGCHPRGDAAAFGIGELGFPNRDDGRGDVPERGDVPVAEARRVVVDSLGGGGDGGGGGEARRTGRGLAALRSPSDENRVATDAVLSSAAEERAWKQSAAVAAARAAAFKYGATTAPAVGAFGQPIQTRPVRETAVGDAADRGGDLTLRRRAAPVGHDVDPVTLLKLSDASLTRAVERDGFSRGEVLVAVDANERGGADHRSGLATVSFADPPPKARAGRLRRDRASLQALPPRASTSCAATCSSAGASTRTCATRTGTRRSSRRARTAPAASLSCVCGAAPDREPAPAMNEKRRCRCISPTRFGFVFAFARWLVDNGADRRAVNENGKKPFEGSL